MLVGNIRKPLAYLQELSMKKIPKFTTISRWICTTALAFTITNASAKVFTNTAINTDETLLATVQEKTATLWDIARGCLQFTHSGSQTMMHPKRTVLR